MDAKAFVVTAAIKTMHAFSAMMISTLTGLAPLLLAAAIAQAAAPDENHVAVTLVSEQTAVVPGKTAWLGIHLVHEPQWHTYWVNPGDSGLPTKVTWSLPDGFRAGEITWPAPKRFDVGGLFNFGYDGDVLLPVPIEVPADAKPGFKVHVSAMVKWLVCHEECVPGKAQLDLDLPVAMTAAADVRWKAQFPAAHVAQPRPSAWSGQARLQGDCVDVALHGKDLPQAAALEVFPVQSGIVAYTPPQIARRDNALVLTFAKSDYYTSAPAALGLVLKSGTSPQAWSVTLPFSVAPSAASNPP